MGLKEENSCKNCQEVIEGKFCSHCGQRAEIGRLSLKEILTEFLSSVFNIDAPFPRTFIEMFTRPHLLIKQFIDGKRKSFYAPVKYMVLCLFLNILIGELIGFDPIENQRSMDTRELSQQSQIGYKAGEFLSQYLNFFLFILPFSISVFSKLFFWKSKYNFAERTAMGFYMAGQFIVISLIPIFLSKLHPKLFNLMFPLSMLYFTFVFYNIFDRNSIFSRLLFSFLTSIFSFFAYIMITFLIALFIVIQFQIK